MTSITRNSKTMDILDMITITSRNARKVRKLSDNELLKMVEIARKQEEMLYEVCRDQWYSGTDQAFDVTDPDFGELRFLRKYVKKLNKQIKKRELN